MHQNYNIDQWTTHIYFVFITYLYHLNTYVIYTIIVPLDIILPKVTTWSMWNVDQTFFFNDINIKSSFGTVVVVVVPDQIHPQKPNPNNSSRWRKKFELWTQDQDLHFQSSFLYDQWFLASGLFMIITGICNNSIIPFTLLRWLILPTYTVIQYTPLHVRFRQKQIKTK